MLVNSNSQKICKRSILQLECIIQHAKDEHTEYWVENKIVDFV